MIYETCVWIDFLWSRFHFGLDFGIAKEYEMHLDMLWSMKYYLLNKASTLHPWEIRSARPTIDPDSSSLFSFDFCSIWKLKKNRKKQMPASSFVSMTVYVAGEGLHFFVKFVCIVLITHINEFYYSFLLFIIWTVYFLEKNLLIKNSIGLKIVKHCYALNGSHWEQKKGMCITFRASMFNPITSSSLEKDEQWTVSYCICIMVVSALETNQVTIS